MNKLYEFECNIHTKTPRQFFSYVKREFKKRTGMEFGWIDDYETWANPFMPDYDKDPDTREIAKNLPFDYQFYYPNLYNFIMEWNDGHGYCYAVEFER